MEGRTQDPGRQHTLLKPPAMLLCKPMRQDTHVMVAARIVVKALRCIAVDRGVVTEDLLTANVTWETTTGRKLIRLKCLVKVIGLQKG